MEESVRSTHKTLMHFVVFQNVYGVQSCYLYVCSANDLSPKIRAGTVNRPPYPRSSQPPPEPILIYRLQIFFLRPVGFPIWPHSGWRVQLCGGARNGTQGDPKRLLYKCRFGCSVNPTPLSAQPHGRSDPRLSGEEDLPIQTKHRTL
jgi:hypothetical protein